MVRSRFGCLGRLPDWLSRCAAHRSIKISNLLYSFESHYGLPVPLNGISGWISASFSGRMSCWTFGWHFPRMSSRISSQDFRPDIVKNKRDGCQLHLCTTINHVSMQASACESARTQKGLSERCVPQTWPRRDQRFKCMVV